MKLITLNLKAVGPFTDVVLDLSAGEYGLHLIYGPNEAGKTSTLRSLSHLLFGFPHLSADNFVHPNDQLRVGGKLRRSDGEVLEFIRRRGKNSVRGSDDISIVAEEHLAQFLGGIDRGTFEALFGIDHERLTRAGEEIRTGQGRLGELLFAAGTGLAGLSQAQKAINQGLDDLFKPRAQNPRINKGVSELRQAQDELKRAQLPSETWQHHDRLLSEAIRSAEHMREQIRSARVDQGRIKRIKAAIPLLVRQRRLTEELDSLGEVVRLHDDFGSEFRKEHDQLRLAEQSIAHTRASLTEIEAQSAHLDPPQLVLDAARETESLQERLGMVEKASTDRVKLENWQQDCEHQARRILRELDRAIDLDEAETLRLRIDEPTTIRRLGQRFTELRVQADSARTTIARHHDQIEHFAKEQADQEQPRELESLRRAVRQAAKAGDLDKILADGRDKLARLEKKGTTALAQLPGWSHSEQELLCLAVPLSATLDQFESQYQEIARRRESLDERLGAEIVAIRELQSRLQTAELSHDVPNDAMLQASRDRRELGWRLVKSDWLNGKPDDEAVKRFVAELAPESNLADAYEQSVHQGDALADRLRREADRVAHRAESLAQLNRRQATFVEFECELEYLDARRAKVDQEWRMLTVPLGIAVDVQTPTELQAWIRQREQVVQTLEKADEARQSVDLQEQAFQKHTAQLRVALIEAGESCASTASDLAESLDKAERVIKRHDDMSRRRATLETKLATARAEQATAELSLRTADAELAEWRTEWSTMMARIGLEANALPEQAEVFLNKLGELFEKLTERRNFQSRIQGIDRDAAEFKRDVTALVERVAPEWTERSADEFVYARELAQLLRTSRDDDQKLAALTQQRQRETTNLRESEAIRARAQICLDRLCKEAGCSDVDALPEAERRSQHRVRLENDRSACAEQLMIVAAGTSLPDFIAEAEQADADSLDSRIDELEIKISAQEEELRRLDQTIGTERAELARMDGSDRAADRAEQVQIILTRLQSDVARYATLKLAAVAMQRGIERYRDKNQGPILARAGALFAGMTGGSFARLQIDDDGEGRSVLKGVRPDGRLVNVENMSDGSHDQLYLALRLASLESWLLSHEPIPFVADDILLNFDDLRATAALAALAELSQRTQVLFFTHHRHIVNLARAHLRYRDIFVHELPGLASRNAEHGTHIRLGEKASD